MNVLILSGHDADKHMALALTEHTHDVHFSGANLSRKSILGRLCEATEIAVAKARKADIIILDGSCYDRTVATTMHKFKAVPLILYLKGYFPAEYEENYKDKHLVKSVNWFAMRCLIKNSAYIVFVSEWLKEKYRSNTQTLLLRDKPSTVVPVGVDPFFCPPDSLSQSQTNNNRYLFYAGNFGYLDKVRGVILLLDAFSRLLSTYPNLRLYICSEGRHKSLLQKRASQLGLESTVVFAGRVSREKLREYYQNAYAFVYPSFLDGSPRTVIEAQACATPAIVTNSSGAAELVINGISGTVCQPNVESLADSITYLMQNPQIRDSMAVQAVKHVQRDLSWKVTAAKFNEVIAILNHPRNATRRKKS